MAAFQFLRGNRSYFNSIKITQHHPLVMSRKIRIKRDQYGHVPSITDLRSLSRLKVLIWFPLFFWTFIHLLQLCPWGALEPIPEPIPNMQFIQRIAAISTQSKGLILGLCKPESINSVSTWVFSGYPSIYWASGPWKNCNGIYFDHRCRCFLSK